MCICPPAYPRFTFPTLVALLWRNLFQVCAIKACSKVCYRSYGTVMLVLECNCDQSHVTAYASWDGSQCYVHRYCKALCMLAILQA